MKCVFIEWHLTITILWAKSIDDKLMALLSLRKQDLKFGDNLHEISKPVFREKILKIFQNVLC